MPGADFDALERQLLRDGIAPRHVRRTIAELEDHFDDLVATCRQRGLPQQAAECRALAQLGSLDDIGVAIAAQPDLQCWYRRWPRAASLLYPVACAAALPFVPVVAGVQHAPSIARWSACLLLSAGFTAALLLAMQLSLYL